MAVIGVDCSGKVDSLPLYMVAARGGDVRVIYVRRIPTYYKRRHREWKTLVYACYAFKAIRPLFQKSAGDTILVDRDFDAESLQRVRKYLELLLRVYFRLPYGGNIVEIGDDSDKPVLVADTASKLARKRKFRFSLVDPNINEEYPLLEKNL